MILRANNYEYFFEWEPECSEHDFGKLTVYGRNRLTSQPMFIQIGVLRPDSVGMPNSLIKRGMYFVDLYFRSKLEDKPLDPREELSDGGRTRYRPTTKAGERLGKAAMKVGSEFLENRDFKQREWILYWFTAFCSSSGSNVYESRDLAAHAAKMLKIHIPNVIVVLTPAQGEIPNDTSEESRA